MSKKCIRCKDGETEAFSKAAKADGYIKKNGDSNFSGWAVDLCRKRVKYLKRKEK